jgi:hydrogenase-4 component F
MNHNIFLLVSVFIGVLTLVTFIRAHRKNQTSIFRWSLMIVLFLVSLIGSYSATDLSLQWVLIESSTLFGAILISSSQTTKSTKSAWKFLLLNSFGLGLAFLGLLLIAYSSNVKTTMQVQELIQKASTASHSALIHIGLWLAVFGYSAKLGLFPNIFWVADTYSDSPSIISSFIASFVPPAVCLALRPLLEIDQIVSTSIVNASNLLLVLSLITILYSIISLYRAEDIRRITAKVALFHSGSLGVLLWLRPSDEILYFFLVNTILIKSFLFLSLGILRMESASRNLNTILQQKSIPKFISLFYIITICAAFTLPISPIFWADVILLKLAISSSNLWVALLPVQGAIFLGIVLSKLIPLLKLPTRKLDPNFKSIIQFRLVVSVIVCIALLWVTYTELLFLLRGSIYE